MCFCFGIEKKNLNTCSADCVPISRRFCILTFTFFSCYVGTQCCCVHVGTGRSIEKTLSDVFLLHAPFENSPHGSATEACEGQQELRSGALG